MITMTQMYWLVTLDSVVHVSFVLAILMALASVGAVGVACNDEGLFWVPLVTIGMFFLSVAVVTFTPTTKQAAAIIIVPKIVNNEKVQTVGNTLYDLAAEWLDELRPKKEAK